MRIALAMAALLLGACAHSGSPQSAAGASPLGLPPRPISQAALDAARLESLPAPSQASVRIPDVLGVSADYRLLVLDGHLALVRDAEHAAADPSLQPALLPQELAAEVASSRESAARMDNALRSVMQRSEELSLRAADLEAEARRLSEQLTASEARVRQLEAGGHPQGQDAQPARAPDP